MKRNLAKKKTYRRKTKKAISKKSKKTTKSSNKIYKVRKSK